jgi:ribose 5-phosphate isomerase B
MPKQFITEQTILDLWKKGERTIVVESGTMFTAAARERASQIGMRIVEKKPEQGSGVSTPAVGTSKREAGGETIAIGSDHGGFQLKQQLSQYLTGLGYKMVDLGTYSEEACDYPDFAYAVARMVSLGEASKGIMIDSVGIASAIVANKVPGIRAACCHDEFSARSSREHNDANVLTLGGKVIGVEAAKSVTKVWLESWFSGGRHQRRVKKISDIESRFFKT